MHSKCCKSKVRYDMGSGVNYCSNCLSVLPLRQYNKGKVAILVLVMVAAILVGFRSDLLAPQYLMLSGIHNPLSKTVTITTYQNTVGQCDDTPNQMASGFYIQNKELRAVAISQDLLKEFPYGTILKIKSGDERIDNHNWVVLDCMNVRYKNCIDVLSFTFNTKINKCTITKQ